MELVQVVNKDSKAIPVKVVSGGSGGGGITGKNIDDGSQINEVSFEVDDNGYPVLRTIDAAPFAYDPVNQSNKVSLVASDKLEIIDVSETFTLQNGQLGSYTLNPDYGEVWEIKHMDFQVLGISGATGTHQIILKYGSLAAGASLLMGRTAGSKAILFRHCNFASSVDTPDPEYKPTQAIAVKGLILTELVPLSWQYRNDTGQEVTVTMVINVIVSKRKSL